MGRGAGAAVAFIIGTVEISDLRVPLIEMKMQVVSAIGTDQQTGKHILFALLGAALADFPPFLLNLLPHGASMIGSWISLKTTQFSRSFSIRFLFL